MQNDVIYTRKVGHYEPPGVPCLSPKTGAALQQAVGTGLPKESLQVVDAPVYPRGGVGALCDGTHLRLARVHAGRAAGVLFRHHQVHEAHTGGRQAKSYNVLLLRLHGRIVRTADARPTARPGIKVAMNL